MEKFLPVAVKGWYVSANSSRKVPKRVPPKKNRGFSLGSFPLFYEYRLRYPDLFVGLSTLRAASGA
jgi:hypothetical protein